MEDKRKTIFVVDDSTSGLEKVRGLLSGTYNVFTLTSGAQLLKLLEKVTPSLILLDIVMPKLNGYEIIDILKSDPSYKDIPVIFLTGSANEESELEGLSKGAVDYIVKPFSVPLLLKRIELHLLLESQKREIAERMEREIIQMKERQEEQKRLEIAEERNNAKTRFLARMSHEIRTPVSAVMGLSEIQSHNPNLPDEVSESFGKIYNSADLLLGIINNLLDLSSIESGKVSLSDKEYETAGLIENIVKSHGSIGKNVAFHAEVDENIPAYLIGDARHIAQIVNNLLTNAFKYTESGFVALSMGCRPGGENLVDLVISVSDSGIGMAPEHMDAIYSDYSRIHEQEKRFVEGTGLGLLIVYSLAKWMDAHVELESNIGQGTKVTVYIPQKLSRPGALGAETARKLEQIDATAAKKPILPPTPMPNAKILVVDDVEINLDITRQFLDLYQIQHDTCSSGEEAIEKINAGNEYDVVFMDQTMPVMTGTETLHELRKMGYAKPVVVFTANTSMGFEEECLNNGFDDFLSKPIRMERLEAILNKFVK